MSWLVLQLFFWCLPLIQHVGHQVDVVTWIFLFPSSCDCFLQVILTRLCQRTLMAWRKLVASCWSMTTQGDHFWDVVGISRKSTRSTKQTETGGLLMFVVYLKFLLFKTWRKGFVDGRTARLPTVVVRPGQPNAATTSCYSGLESGRFSKLKACDSTANWE